MTQDLKNNIYIHIGRIYLLRIIFKFVFLHQKNYSPHSGLLALGGCFLCDMTYQAYYAKLGFFLLNLKCKFNIQICFQMTIYSSTLLQLAR